MNPNLQNLLPHLQKLRQGKWCGQLHSHHKQKVCRYMTTWVNGRWNGPRWMDPLGSCWKPLNPFKLLINVLNIYIYHLHKLIQGPWVQIHSFWAVLCSMARIRHFAKKKRLQLYGHFATFGKFCRTMDTFQGKIIWIHRHFWRSWADF